MPLFTYPPAPFEFYLDDPVAGATTAVTAGAAYLNGITVLAPVTISQMRCFLGGSPTGSIDMGIYDATGTNEAPNNLLGHTGANAAVAGVFTKSMTANLLLSPGKYWLAIIDTVADSILLRQAASTGLVVTVRTTATNLTVLPSTIGTVADDLNRIGIQALRLNSFS